MTKRSEGGVFLESKVSAVLLASGLSHRMGEDKLLLVYQGKTLLQRAVDLVSLLPVYEKILLTTTKCAESLMLPPDFRVVVNAQPEVGQSESIRLGVAAATGDWYFFMPADQPRLTVDDLLPILHGAEQNNGKIIYPVINGHPSSPSLFSSFFRDELLGLSGDLGGRVVRAGHPDACVEIKPKCPGNFVDIDNREEYMLLECRM